MFRPRPKVFDRPYTKVLDPRLAKFLYLIDTSFSGSRSSASVALVGGICRDLYWGYPFKDVDCVIEPYPSFGSENDLDLHSWLASLPTDHVDRRFEELGVKIRSHYSFCDLLFQPMIYDQCNHVFDRSNHFVPLTFDFTINALSFSHDVFHGNFDSFYDLDHRNLRLTRNSIGRIHDKHGHISTTTFFRALRFMTTYQLVLRGVLVDEIKNFVSYHKGLDERFAYVQLQKMIDAGLDTNPQLIKTLKDLDVPFDSDFSSLRELSDEYYKKVKSGHISSEEKTTSDYAEAVVQDQVEDPVQMHAAGFPNPGFRDLTQ